MEQLHGKVAVVTGSGSGLGRAMAERFAQEGMIVVIADNRLDAAEEVASAIETAGGRALPFQVDVTDRASVQALADRVDAELGGTDVLVNNAGVAAPTSYVDDDDAGWRWVTEVNFFGVLYGIQTFVPRMLERGGDAHVVSTASLGGVIGPLCLEGNRTRAGDRRTAEGGPMKSYMTSKHAVVALSEGLAGDLDGTPVGVSVLCPAHHEPSHIYENSARFRPAEFGGPMGEDNELAADRATRVDQGHRDASELAARVVRAIRERHFYIFTHPETRFLVEARFAQMLAGFDDAASFEG